MGGYLSSKKKPEEGVDCSREATSEEKKKSRFKVVYTDRDVGINELPRDLGALFVLRRAGSMYMDEDGHYAHEFYREKKVKTRRGTVKWIMVKISNALLSPQGEVKHPHPRLHADFPLVLLDSNAIIVPRRD